MNKNFEEEFISVNSKSPITQYMLYYNSKDAPVLLFIHGGPGVSESSLGYVYKELINDKFSIAFYDQRGAGRTLIKNPKELPIMEVLLEDLHDTVEYLKKKYGVSKISILGHSWGTILGYIYSLTHPHNVEQYIGLGQAGNMRLSEEINYKKLKETIFLNGSKRDNKKLAKLGTYPPALWTEENFINFIKASRLRDKYRLTATVKISITKLAKGNPVKFKIYDFKALYNSRKVNGGMHIRALNEFDPLKYGFEFKMPVLFITGENDYITPIGALLEVFKQISAPQKELVMIKNAGHFLPFEQREEFAQAIHDYVK